MEQQQLEIGQFGMEGVDIHSYSEGKYGLGTKKKDSPKPKFYTVHYIKEMAILGFVISWQMIL